MTDFHSNGDKDNNKRVLIFNVSVWQWDSAVERRGRVLHQQQLQIQDGFIVDITPSVGSVDEVNMDQFDTVIDGKGRLLLPGLIDSHIHINLLGESQHYVNLDSCLTIQDLQQCILDAAGSDDALPFIVGYNWDQTKLGRLPQRADLDALSIDKPIYLWRACWHIGVANTKALELANYLPTNTSSETIPWEMEGGELDRGEDGQPTGILKERAVEPVINALAKFKSHEHVLRFLKEGMDLCVKAGLTSVQTNDEGCLTVYEELQREQSLPLRVMLTPVQAELASVVKKLGGPVSPFPFSKTNTKGDASDCSTRLGVERLKIFSDGSLGADTAALSLVDADNKDAYKGILIHESTDLQQMVVDAMKAKFRLEIHAIGDAAAAQVLRAMQGAKKAVAGQFELFRPILTHCQVLSKDLVDQMRELNVIANVQPPFVPTDMRWVGDRLRPEQLSYAYAWKTLIESGVHVAGGSDAPVEHPSPFIGLHDAIFRSNGRKPGVSAADKTVFRAEECLTFDEALWMYTVEGAYAAGYEQYLGRIAVDYIADLVFVDPAFLDKQELLFDLKPDLVLVGGSLVANNATGDDGQQHVPKVLKGSLESSSAAEDNKAYEQRVNAEGPYVPGKGGSFAPRRKYRKTPDQCQVVGFCACQLNKEYCF